MEEGVGIRELKARLSSYLKRVKKGETVLITEHGRPVARIAPVEDSPAARAAALDRAGLLAWNGEQPGSVEPVARVTQTTDVSTLISEDRD